MWKNKFFLLYIILLLIALLSALGLDYIRGKKGEKAYIFPTLVSVKKPIAAEESLGDIVLKKAESLGINPDDISHYLDNEGIQHIMISLSLPQYTHLDSFLTEEFSKIEALTAEKIHKQDERRQYYLWQVKDEVKQQLFLLFSCQMEQVAQKKPPPPPKDRKRFAIIVDDMGYSLDAINDISSLNTALTVAILPYSPLGRETAHIAKDSHLEVILHLPLESLNNVYDNNNTEGIIHTGMSRDEIIRNVQKSLAQIPFIVGVNTHMGSKITTDAELMRVILGQLQGKRLFFIDSRTTARSVAHDVAQEMGIPSGRRHVFLDSEVDEEFIKNQLYTLFQEAEKNGSAIGICHPSPETLKVLQENLHKASEYGVFPVYVSDIVQ
jgi:polysaccharide deacetylase 2 family uncharacterized protein YibQ